MRVHLYHRYVYILLRAHAAALVLVLMASPSAWLAAQTPGSPSPAAKWQPAPVPAWQSAAGGHQEFDVDSVRQNKSGTPWSGGDKMTMNVPYGPDDNFRVTGGVLSAKNYPLLNLIVFAYKVPTAQGEALLASLPVWTNSDLFDIEARTDNRDVTKDQMRLMMQALLADRFHLDIHRELRQVSLSAAVLVKPGTLGPNLRPHPADQPCSPIYVAPKDGGAQPAPPNPHAFAGGFPLRCRTFGPGPATEPYFKTEGARDLPMETIVSTFSGLGNLGRPAIDQTGLTGTYDWYIEFLPELPPGVELQGRPQDASGPSFTDALRKQLGIGSSRKKALTTTLSSTTSSIPPKIDFSRVAVRVNLLKCSGPPSDCKGKVADEESLRQCIRPVCGEVSPGHDEIRRVPVLRNPSAV